MHTHLESFLSGADLQAIVAVALHCLCLCHHNIWELKAEGGRIDMSIVCVCMQLNTIIHCINLNELR